MQFDTPIMSITSDFFNSKSGKNCRSRPFESEFWPILTVFVIRCGVQSPRWSRRLIRAKDYLFAAFWYIDHLFYRIVGAQWLFYLEIATGNAQWTTGLCRCPKFFGACARLLVLDLLLAVSYYEQVPDLFTWSLVISVILRYRSTTVTTCPIFLKHSYLGT